MELENNLRVLLVFIPNPTHKQKTGCNAANIDKLLLKNNQVVGYTCSCGKNYYQKHLIAQRAQAFIKNKIIPTMKINSQVLLT